jgi:hypothetical protein
MRMACLLREVSPAVGTGDRFDMSQATVGTTAVPRHPTAYEDVV